MLTTIAGAPVHLYLSSYILCLLRRQLLEISAFPNYHQQYLAKNPGGYCGLGGTGVSCPVSPLTDG